jgi:hypothetical protein
MAYLTGKVIRNTYGGILLVSDDNVGATSTLKTAYTGDGAATALQVSTTTVNINGTFTVNGAPVSGGSGAPTDATYICKTANGTLSDEFALSTLATGYVKVTTTTGDLTSTATLPTTDLSGTLQATQFPALTGDITTSAGAVATTLATVNANVGSFGSATNVGTFTVNAKGLVTAASNTAIQITEAQVTDLVTDLGNKQGLDATLTSIAALGTAADKTIYTTGIDTWAETALTSYGRSLIDDADASTARTTLGVAIGTNVQAYDATLAALAAYNTNGLLTQTAADTFTGRTLTAPAAGITVTDGNGVAGNPTLVLANDLAGVEGLSTAGIATRTASDTWTTRTITGTANEVSVADGDGVAGAPTLSLPSTVDLSSKILKVPNGTAPTVNATGSVAVDTNTDNTNITHGSLVFYDGVSARYNVSIDTLPSTDGHVLTYDGTNKKFYFAVAPGAGGGASTGNQYVTLAAAGDLTAERTLTAGANLKITDGGANSTVTLAVGTENLAFAGDISPAQIVANTNDYDPAGLSTATVLRLSTDASRNITSLAGGADGRVIIIHNVGSFNIVLTDDDGATGTAGNRFALTNNITLTPDSCVILQYDSTTSRWRALSSAYAYDPTIQALSAYNTNGLITQTAADTFTGRTITGTAGTITVSDGNGVAGNPTLTIDAAYIGQNTITTLGTVTTGTWSATAVAVDKGGTGQTTYTDGQLLIGNTTGNTLAKATLTATANETTVTNGNGSITLGLSSTVDLSGKTSFAIPSAAGGTTINGAGEVCVDTTSKTVNFYNGAAETTLDPQVSKSITIENPTSSEKIAMFRADSALTVTKIHAILIGSSTPSVTYKIHKGNDLSAAGTAVVTAGSTVTSVTTGTSVTSFDSAGVTSGDMVWLTTTAQSGTVTQMCVTVYYTRDA